MDEITKGWIETARKQHPKAAITFSEQFLDGTEKHECGVVPNDWDGVTRVYYTAIPPLRKVY